MQKKNFEQKIATLQQKQEIQKKEYALWGNAKVLSFGVTLALCFYYYNRISIIFYCLLIPLLIFFVYVCYRQYQMKQQLHYTEGLLEINDRYIQRIDGDWTAFVDDGGAFFDAYHDYANDLDIVGKKSLYQFSRIANTIFGKNAFSRHLLFPNASPSEILVKQETTKELAQKNDFCQDLEFFTSQIKENDALLPLIAALKNPSHFIEGTRTKNILRFWFLGTFTVVALGFCFLKSYFSVIVTLCLLSHGVLWLVYMTKILAYTKGIDRLGYTLQSYTKVFARIEKESFQSSQLKAIYETLFAQYNAPRAIRSLHSIIQQLNLKYQPLFYFMMNVLFLWDIRCCIELDEWKTAYGAMLEEWFLALGELESSASFSVFNKVLEQTVYPSVTEDLQITCKTLGHPLIQQDKRVCNDITLRDQIAFISGSNMSGKTTFLRTLGINLVLCYNGSVVCATVFSAPILRIATSMRITDDLNEGISTFYAELLKIKQILSVAQQNVPMIFLIDEIFRGTNSRDRLFGAKAVLQQLNRPSILGLMTTHDLEICEQMNDQRIVNYHFEEHYTADRITFDYKLKPGISTTTNGVQLMQMVGIMNL